MYWYLRHVSISDVKRTVLYCLFKKIKKLNLLQYETLQPVENENILIQPSPLVKSTCRVANKEGVHITAVEGIYTECTIQSKGCT